MRLELVTPPRLVSVGGRPALVLATRGDRSYVQVSRGPGVNHLRWVPASALAAGGAAVPVPGEGAAPTVRLPRSQR